jgi:hypothetical protein
MMIQNMTEKQEKKAVLTPVCVCLARLYLQQTFILTFKGICKFHICLWNITNPIMH